jgi:hypothetical protein
MNNSEQSLNGLMVESIATEESVFLELNDLLNQAETLCNAEDSTEAEILAVLDSFRDKLARLDLTDDEIFITI